MRISRSPGTNSCRQSADDGYGPSGWLIRATITGVFRTTARLRNSRGAGRTVRCLSPSRHTPNPATKPRDEPIGARTGAGDPHRMEGTPGVSILDAFLIPQAGRREIFAPSRPSARSLDGPSPEARPGTGHRPALWPRSPCRPSGRTSMRRAIVGATLPIVRPGNDGCTGHRLQRR